MTDIPTGRNNTLVAESDLQAAYNAMDERLQRVLQQHPESDHPLLQQCVTHLKNDLDRIAEPISDEAFHVYLKRHDYEYKQEDTKVDEESSNKQKGHDEEEKTPEETYDDEDLLDPEAWQRVQELRVAAREQAARVQSIRTQVLDQSVALAQRQAQHWMGKQQQQQQQATTVDEVDMTDMQHRVQAMQESWTQLQQALAKQSKELPRHLSGLQETVAVVEEHLQKPTAATQTEQAIRDRTEPVMVDLQPVPQLPEERLAQFLS